MPRARRGSRPISVAAVRTLMVLVSRLWNVVATSRTSGAAVTMPPKWNTTSGLSRVISSCTATASTASHCHQRRPSAVSASRGARETAWTSAPPATEPPAEMRAEEPTGPGDEGPRSGRGAAAAPRDPVYPRIAPAATVAAAGSRSYASMSSVGRCARSVHAQVVAHRRAGAGRVDVVGAPALLDVPRFTVRKSMLKRV